MEQKSGPSFTIRKSRLGEAALAVQTALNGLFDFFSLKISKQFWGVVYDSVSKQPLDPVIVKLLYVDGREVETCITDLGGRYGFLARPGKFKIFARKTNYVFPSRYVKGGDDGIYENLYHGEFFTLFDDSEVVAPNIPMDPANFDWNQQAKKAVSQTRPFGRLLLKRLARVFFWFGFLFCAALLLRLRSATPPAVYFFLAGYALMVFLAYFVGQTRLWGRAKINFPLEAGARLLLELRKADLGAVTFGQTVVNEQGRFLLRANPGSYILEISRLDQNRQKHPLGALPVKVGSSGLINSTILIKILA